MRTKIEKEMNQKKDRTSKKSNQKNKDQIE